MKQKQCDASDVLEPNIPEQEVHDLFFKILAKCYYVNQVMVRANLFSTSTERREEKWRHCALERVKVKGE